jgi:hypothetical protein
MSEAKHTIAVGGRRRPRLSRRETVVVSHAEPPTVDARETLAAGSHPPLPLLHRLGAGSTQANDKEQQE